MKQEDLYEQIEAYLNDTLSPDERQVFEQRLAEDPELRREVELHRQLQQDYDAGRLQLRARLRTIMDEPLPADPAGANRPGFRWPFWTGLILLALVAVWGLRQWPKPAPGVELPPATLPSAPADTTPENSPAPNPATPTQTPTPSRPGEPIAAADPARFKPHPGMEAFVNGGVRSETITIKMTSPVNGQRFKRDQSGAATIRFAGSGNWPGDFQPKGFNLLIFNNLDPNTPLLELPVRTKDVAGSLGFNMQERLTLTPGLYYFTVEEKEAGAMLYAGKFFVD